ncbi:MAG: hypothetical protein ACOC0Z_06480 [Halohasta sp.]
MNRRHIVIVLVVGAIALGVGFYGPIGGEDSADGSTGPTYDHDSEEAPFAFSIDRIQECGAACREVTTTLTNSRDGTASDVTVTTALYAGENTTDDGARLWEGSEDVGTLDPDDSETTTRRVDLSIDEASRLSEAGGWVTIETTVESDERTVTFRDSREVG